MFVALAHILVLGSLVLPGQSSHPGTSIKEITQKLNSGNFSQAELEKVERIIDSIERSKGHTLTSVVCTLGSFHIGQQCCKESLPLST